MFRALVHALKAAVTPVMPDEVPAPDWPALRAGIEAAATVPPAPPIAGFHPCPIPERGTLTVYVSAVHDGDTVTACLLVPLTTRLEGVNAPELHTPAGPASRDALAGLVNGHLLTAQLLGKEKYGRTLMRLWKPQGDAPPIDVSQWMTDGKWAVPWDGHGPRPTP